ncbi:MAG: hypothetical protein JW769_04265 [Parachlamydiales bacterium]|nr:hypothetical protein [Parachlamydiales bacterium]
MTVSIFKPVSFYTPIHFGNEIPDHLRKDPFILAERLEDWVWIVHRSRADYYSSNFSRSKEYCVYNHSSLPRLSLITKVFRWIVYSSLWVFILIGKIVFRMRHSFVYELRPEIDEDFTYDDRLQQEDVENSIVGDKLQKPPERNLLAGLPDEMIGRVVDFLNPRGLQHFSKTCVHFSNIVDEKYLTFVDDILNCRDLQAREYPWVATFLQQAKEAFNGGKTIRPRGAYIKAVYDHWLRQWTISIDNYCFGFCQRYLWWTRSEARYPVKALLRRDICNITTYQQISQLIADVQFLNFIYSLNRFFPTEFPITDSPEWRNKSNHEIAEELRIVFYSHPQAKNLVERMITRISQNPTENMSLFFAYEFPREIALRYQIEPPEGDYSILF